MGANGRVTSNGRKKASDVNEKSDVGLGPTGMLGYN